MGGRKISVFDDGLTVKSIAAEIRKMRNLLYKTNARGMGRYDERWEDFVEDLVEFFTDKFKTKVTARISSITQYQGKARDTHCKDCIFWKAPTPDTKKGSKRVWKICMNPKEIQGTLEFDPHVVPREQHIELKDKQIRYTYKNHGCSHGVRGAYIKVI
jgi:hypothetical protein